MKATSGAGPVLELRDLHVEFADGARRVHAVNGVSLQVAPGECLAVVGESGSGKSQTFLAALGLLPPAGRASGSVRLDGREILGLPEHKLRAVRGAAIGTVFQDPINALTPHLRIEDHLVEVLVAHRKGSHREHRARALAALESVQLPEPRQRLRQYPHELSGGMRQRVALAIALIAEPRVLIADEPTTALDVTVQAQVVELLRRECRRGLALVFISHDIALLGSMADRVAVMYAGRVVEAGPADRLLADPRHPYSQALIASVPDLHSDRRARLREIAGQPPRPGRASAGCAFEPRCAVREAPCRELSPAVARFGEDREVACHVAARGCTP
jgi:oligopeptide/dipeptide ABC transporter ATP-binding protein